MDLFVFFCSLFCVCVILIVNGKERNSKSWTFSESFLRIYFTFICLFFIAQRNEKERKQKKGARPNGFFELLWRSAFFSSLPRENCAYADLKRLKKRKKKINIPPKMGSTHLITKYLATNSNIECDLLKCSSIAQKYRLRNSGKPQNRWIMSDAM